MSGLKFFILSVGDVVRGEMTNIGVAVFDLSTGKRVAARTGGFDRAVSRGDLPAAAQETFPAVVEWHVDLIPTLADAERVVGSPSNAMSHVQWRRGGNSVLTDHNALLGQSYARYIG